MKLGSTSVKSIFRGLAAAFIAVGAISLSMPEFAYAEGGAQKRGRVTDLPVPRFVSFKASAVNLRVGPGRKYAISWLYKKRGLPVEVIQEFDRWRRVRDAEGTTGWVLHSLISSRRTALIAPWDREADESGNIIKASFHEGKNRARAESATTAKMQAGLLVDVVSCEQNWCEVEAGNTSAWLPQNKLWGVYPGERVED